MKSISNSNLSLLTDKLPIIMEYARKAIPASDLKAYNALRMLLMFHKKLVKQKTCKKNMINSNCNEKK